MTSKGLGLSVGWLGRRLGQAVLAGTILAGPAMGSPLVLPGGPIYIQFNNLEQLDALGTNSIAVPGGSIDVNGDGIVDTPASEGNWGVVNTSTMQRGSIATDHTDISGGTTFFFDDGPGKTYGQVTGIFYGITTTSATTATGGWLDLYWADPVCDVIQTADLDGNTGTGTYDDPTARTSANTIPGFADPGGPCQSLLVRLQFVPGIIMGDGTTTLQSTVAITQGLSGQAEGFANVVDINNDGVIDDLDGPWATAFDGDWFFTYDADGSGAVGDDPSEIADFRFSTFFNFTANGWDGADGTKQPNQLPGGIEGLRSNDPARFYNHTEVTVEKTPDFGDDPQPVYQPGQTACFDIKVTNQGPGTATGVILDDELTTGDGFGPLSWYENPDLAACAITANSGDKLHCVIGDLEESASFSVTVCTDIPAATPAAPVVLLGASDFNATDGNLLLDNSEIPPGVGAPDTDAKDWKTWADGGADDIDCSTHDGCVYDTPSGSTDNSYTQGAKEDDESPVIDFGSIPPSKDDLNRWYWKQEPISNQVYLYLAWIRNNQLGTATIDFELNQSGDTAPNGVNPVRTEDDVLITYDFLGGRVDEIGLLRWLTAAGGHTAAECEANSSLPCWGNKLELLDSGLAEGAVNFYDNGTNKPGDDGYPVYDPIEDETIEKERFGEAAINFTAAIGSADECLVFGQAFVKSRASGSSFTSELKDFIGPVPVNLSNCVEVPNTALADWDNALPDVYCEADSSTYGACDDGGFFINSIIGD
jgi:uncharacterized repeat protein (TIGR01451 family)